MSRMNGRPMNSTYLQDTVIHEITQCEPVYLSDLKEVLKARGIIFTREELTDWLKEAVANNRLLLEFKRRRTTVDIALRAKRFPGTAEPHKPCGDTTCHSCHPDVFM